MQDNQSAAIDNVQLRTDYGVIIAELDLQKKAALTQVNQINSQLTSLNSQQQLLFEQLNRADFAGDTALKTIIQERIDENNQRIASTNLALTNVQKDIATYDQSLNSAYSNLDAAEAGPDGLNSVPGPGSANPGSVLTVPPPTATVNSASTNNAVTDSDPLVAQIQAKNFDDVIAAQPASLGAPIPQDTEFFTGRATAATYELAEQLAIEEARTNAFNTFGNTTQFTGVPNLRVRFNNNGTYTATYVTQAAPSVVPAPVTENEGADRDPFEQSRQEAEERVNRPAPTPVTDEDPFEQSRLEAEQRLNEPAAASIVNSPAAVTDGDPFEQSRLEAEERLNEPAPTEADILNAENSRISALANEARNQQTLRDQRNNKAQSRDWRVRLSLAPNTNYLYNAGSPRGSAAGILAPLADTNGVIFPYTPSIETAYKANYDTYDLVHSNYRGYFYKNSYVDAVNLRATFTAQDTNEANYLLAVIHFFRSVTKMFYGQNTDQRGAPPPLVFIRGYGDFQFSNHPCLVSQFNYTLPPDVDYIRAQSVLDNNTNLQLARLRSTVANNPLAYSARRILNSGLFPGALDKRPTIANNLSAGNPTYVPTKIEISVSLLPIQSRQQISKNFSVDGFAKGNLLSGGFW